MSVQIVEAKEKMRTLLVVGASEDDARAFIADVERRRRVPDDMWPMDETLHGRFAGPAQLNGAIAMGYSYDLVFITEAGLAALTEDLVNLAHSRATAGTWIEASAPATACYPSESP